MRLALPHRGCADAPAWPGLPACHPHARPGAWSLVILRDADPSLIGYDRLRGVMGCRRADQDDRCTDSRRQRPRRLLYPACGPSRRCSTQSCRRCAIGVSMPKLAPVTSAPLPSKVPGFPDLGGVAPAAGLKYRNGRPDEAYRFMYNDLTGDRITISHTAVLLRYEDGPSL